ncbi:hypothetical protein [Arenibaculum sp.]|jgi:hypothetical protein|uniref:hypothetical protein n=1 Tax=Arenibaculum sp. TaxID=2865862 RepID=UPI002E14A02E|nr:hypothetical protein [Arenibaculum sp.]
MKAVPPSLGFRNACEGMATRGPIRAVDAVGLVAALRGGDYEKDEFETTQAFWRRIGPKIDGVLAKAGGEADGTLVVTFPLDEALATYEADKGILTIGNIASRLLRLGRIVVDRDHGPSTYVSVSSNERRVGRYVGGNAFGATTNVVKVERDVVGVAVPSYGRYFWPNEFTPIQARLAPHEARAAKTALAVMMVGRLRAPFILTWRDRDLPEFDNPVDRTTDIEVLNFAPDCAAVLDRSSGKILADIPLADWQ